MNSKDITIQTMQLDFNDSAITWMIVLSSYNTWIKQMYQSSSDFLDSDLEKLFQFFLNSDESDDENLNNKNNENDDVLQKENIL